jgi:thiamine-monophosphate kinase
VASPADASRPHAALGPGREFDLVRRLIARWGPLAQGIGDDAAVLDVPAGQRLVVSTDASVEDVHFRRAWLTPREIGRRAAVSALSDLAAMAAAPLGVVVAIALPDVWRAAIDELADGIGDAVRECGATIVGGDLTRATELSITLTVLGAAAAPLGRGGARAGDAVYVTGVLGGPLLALRAWERGDEPAAADRARFAGPVARLAEARWLADRGATALVDVSDGLAADLGHVAAASGVRLRVDADRLPRADGAGALEAAASGEEYELALTAPADLDADAFVAALGTRLTRIGIVEACGAGERPGVVLEQGGRRVDLPGGHDHFTS